MKYFINIFKIKILIRTFIIVNIFSNVYLQQINWINALISRLVLINLSQLQN